MPVCEVCWVREAVGKCVLCGRWVCSKHLSPNGLCSICSELMCELCRSRVAIGTCLICGKLICRKCSIELQPGIRVCRVCFSRLSQLVRNEPRLRYLRRYLRSKELNSRT